MIAKQQVKETCSLHFVNVFKFQESKFKILQKNLIQIISIKKYIFLGKATSHNDHCMINMGGQRPKIGSNLPLTSLYLQS